MKRILLAAGAAIAALGGVSAKAVPLTDLIALYTFENGDASDSSGNGNDGVVVGGGVTFGGAGTGIGGTRGAGFTPTAGLSGINTGIDINASALPRLTMGGWFNFGSTGQGVGAKVMSHDNGGFDRTLGIDSRGDDAGFDYAAFTGSGVADVDGDVSFGTWVHLAVVYTGTETKLYLNGILAEMADDATDADVSAFMLFLGANPGFNEDFDGWMDDVFVFGRDLSDSEIDDIFTNGFADPVPLPAGIWLFGTALAGVAASRRRKSKR